MPSYRDRSPEEDEVQDTLNSVRPPRPAPPAPLGGWQKTQSAARSGDPSAQQALNQQYAAENAAALDQERYQRQMALKQQRDAERAAREQAKLAEEERQRQVRQGEAKGIETETDIETGKRTLAANEDGTPRYKTGKVGEPYAVPAIAAVPGVGDAAVAGLLDPGNPLNQPVDPANIRQDYRDARGNIRSAELEAKTDKQTGIQTVKVPDGTGREVEHQVGIDQRAKRLAQMEEERAAMTLRGQDLEYAGHQIRPKFEEADKAEREARQRLEALDRKGFQRGEDGKWKKFNADGVPEMANPIALAHWQKERGEAQAVLQRSMNEKSKVQPGWDQWNEAKDRLAQDRLRHDRERFAVTYGFSPGDETLSDIGSRFDQPPAQAGPPRDLAADADPGISPQKTADPERAVLQGAAEASKSDGSAPLFESTAATSPARTPEAAAEFARGALDGLKNPENLTVRKIGNAFQIMRDGQSFGFVNYDDAGAWIELNSMADTPSVAEAANVGSKKGVPVYLGPGTEARKNPAQAAEWVKQVSQEIDAPLQPGETPAARQQQLAKLGADYPSIVRATRNGDLPMQVGESMVQRIYGKQASMKATDPNDPADFQRWLNETSKQQNAQHLRDYGQPSPETNATKWADKTNLQQRNELRREYLADWYQANRGLPGVTRAKVQQMMGYDVADDATTGEKVLSATRRAGRFLRDDTVGSMAGMFAGGFKDLGAAEVALFGNQEAAKELGDSIRLRNRDWANWTNAAKRNAKAWTTDEGQKTSRQFEQAVSNLKQTIDTEYDKPVPDQQVVEAAVKQATAAALAMHNLAPDESWPVTEESLDPNHDGALGGALARYISTADPREMDLYKERLLMNNGRRQLSAEMEQKTRKMGKFGQAFTGGMYAGWQELGSEMVGDTLAVMTAGGTKLAQVGLEAVGKAGAASRIARMATATKRAFDAVEKFGILEDSLVKPLARGQRVRNAVVGGLKTAAAAGAGEGLEEVITEPGSDSPDFVNAFIGGAGGGLMLAPGHHVAGHALGSVADRMNRGKVAAEDAKFARQYNAMMADTPGFKEITGEDAGAARALVNSEEFQSISRDYQQAKAEFDASHGAALAEAGNQSVPDPKLAKKLENVRGQLGKIRDEMSAPDVTPERLAVLDNQEKKLSAIEADTAAQVGPTQSSAEDSGSLDRLMQARQKLDDVFSRASAQTVQAVDAVNEIGELGDQAQQTFYRGVAKVAAGNIDALTSNERQAIAGAKTKEGAAFFAEVPQADGSARTVLTDEARAQLRSDMPALGRLVRTTESDALFESQLSPQKNNEQDVQGQPGGEAVAQAPVPVPAVSTGATRQAVAGDAGGNAEVAQPSQAQAEGAVNPAALDAVEYEAFRAANPSAPEIRGVVAQAFSARRPVSVSMAKAAGVEIPDGYTRRGTTWEADNQTAASAEAGDDAARGLVEGVKSKVEASLPALRGRLKVVDSIDGGMRTGGVMADPRDGTIQIVMDDVRREMAHEGRSAADYGDILEALIVRHEAVHLVQFEAVRQIWEQQGFSGEFGTFLSRWYDRMASEMPAEAFDVARRIYGEQAWDAIPSEAGKAAEFVRMLVEAKLDPEKADRFSELFRAVKDQSKTLIETLRAAVDMLVEMIRTGTLPESVRKHVDQITELYREMQGSSENAVETVTNGADTAETITEPAETVTNGETGKESLQVESQPAAPNLEETGSKSGESEVLDEFTPLRVIGQAIDAAAASDPRLTPKLKRELEFAIEDLDAVLATLPGEQRRATMDDAIRGWLDEKFPAKQPRTIDKSAKVRAREILNGGEYKALSALFLSGDKIAPRPNLISLVLGRKRAGERLTTKQIETLRNLSDWDDAAFQNQFEASGNGRLAREILSLLMARQGEGVAPNVMAGRLGKGKTASDLWQAVGKELNAIATGQRADEAARLDPNRDWTDAEISAAEASRFGDATAERQADAFESANTPANGRAIQVADFTPDDIGAVLNVDGEEMTVTSVEMDSLGVEAESIVLDDHARFGRQVMENGEVVYVESEEDLVAPFASPTPGRVARSASVSIPDAVIAHDLGAATSHPEYAAAKAGDRVAALRLARQMVTPQMRAAVKALIGDSKPVLVPVLALEEAGHNMIPAAVAVRLAETLGLEATADVHQSVKAHRSGKSALDRIFSQAAFDGPVEAGREYLLVDDTLTQGGTFAALADHITRNGGKVVGAVALTGKQYSATLRLSEGLLTQLRERLGDVENDFRRATGYGFDRLTESEARSLVKFRPLDRVRNRILEEGNARRDGLDEGPEGQGVAPLGSSPTEQGSVELTPKQAVEAAAAETNTDPTDGQKEAGNYRKGKVTLHGLRISIENPRGSTRSGVNRNGKAWSNEMAHHYGYFLGTEGKDGDHVDTFVGPTVGSEKVWVVNQIDPSSRRFDEHKVMLGFTTRREAIDGYLANYSPGWKGVGDVVETTVDGLKNWLENGDTTKRFDAGEASPKPASVTALAASPAPETSDAVQSALDKMPAIYRQVFTAVNEGATPEEVMKRFDLSEKAVTNILNAVRSRMTTATGAAAESGLKPVMRGDKLADGRPDLALSANPVVATVDQIRNESGIPDVRGFDEIRGEAEEMLRKDYGGTYDALLAKASELQPMTDTEVMAAKSIIARETLEGRTQSAAERVKIALLIHGYRDIGTETARALAVRRDPTMKPAERHAQFIAEALFTPDAATRARMRKNPAGQESILAGWMRRVDSIKADLLAQGIDLDATLADYKEKADTRKRAEAESPRVAAAIEETYRKRTKREKAVIQAIRDGALASKAAFLTGMSVEEIKPIWTTFVSDYRKTMRESAERFIKSALAASPSDAFLSQLEREFGIFDWDAIDDTKPNFVDHRYEKPRKRKDKMPEAERPGMTPEQHQALKDAFERFRAADPSTWTSFWQEEMKNLVPLVGQKSFETFKGEAMKPWRDLWQTEMAGLQPQSRVSFEDWAAQPIVREKTRTQKELFREPVLETTGTWDDRRSFQGQGELMREKPSETAGTWDKANPDPIDKELFPHRFGPEIAPGVFDIHDPVQMKKVIDAFAIARGSKMDAVTEFWRASVLTGPQTHIVNTSSNVLNAAYHLLPRRAAEAAINDLLGLVGQGSERSATFAEFVPMARQLRRSVQFAARNALRSWQTESRVFEHAALATAQQLDFTGVGTEYVPPALAGKFGKVMRSLSFRAMSAADEFIKSVIGRMEAAAQAHRMAAVEEKLSGAAYESRFAALMEPGSAAWIRAVDEAKRITFQEDLDGSRPQAIHRIDQLAELAKRGRNMPWIGRPLTFFLPFIDTPTNILKQSLEMSPLGGVLAIIDGARALRRRVFRGDMSPEEAKLAASELYDRARFVRDATNQTIAVAAFFALQGLVAPSDDDEDGLPVVTGSVPYKSTRRGERDVNNRTMPAQTIRFGDKQISYARIEPFATTLASMVDLMVSAHRNGGLMKPAVASQWATGMKDAMKDKTFLQGVSDLINALEDPDRFAERLTANVVTGFVPNIIRQPLRETDRVVRDTNPRAEDGFFSSVAKRVGYSVVPQAAPVKIDVWGNEVPSRRGDEVGGFRATDSVFRVLDPTNFASAPKIDPIDRWIFNWNLNTADPKERISIEPISDKLQATVDGKKTTLALTPAEQMAANREAGRMAREMLGDDWDWRKLDPEKADAIRETVKQAQKMVRAGLRMRKTIAEPSGEE